jgi:hypothetical protein
VLCLLLASVTAGFSVVSSVSLKHLPLTHFKSLKQSAVDEHSSFSSGKYMKNMSNVNTPQRIGSIQMVSDSSIGNNTNNPLSQ